MGLFSKKYDLKKDSLRIKFNLVDLKYEVRHGNGIVPYESLNRRTKKILNKQNGLLLKNSQLLEQEKEQAEIIERYKKLQQLGLTCDSFEYLGEINGTMSPELEKMLNRLTSEKDVLLGIHRIGADDSQEKIQDILTTGLKMTGHLGGAVLSEIRLGNTVSYYPSNKTIIKELMHANAYKNSKGSILIRIPDNDLSGNIFITDKDGLIRLDPKYIIGYVPLEPNNHIETIITPSELKVNTISYNQMSPYSPEYSKEPLTNQGSRHR